MLYFIGQCLIGLFFIVTGIHNIRHFNRQIAHLEKTIIPFPQIALLIALVLQMGGGISLVFNYYALYGAIANIIFTVLATFFFMRFWEEKEEAKRNIMFLFFVEHIAVLGGLLMIIAKQLST